MQKQRRALILLGLLALAVVMAILIQGGLREKSATVFPTVVAITATPSNVTASTPFSAGQAPTATPVAGIENFPEVAGYGHWTTLKKVGEDIEVERRKPPASSSCAIHIKGPHEALVTNTQCTATDERGVSFVVPWPGWVDSCKLARFITPAITEPMTLTVDVSNQAVMYVVPGEHERVECIIGNRAYQAGDVFPVPGGVSYVIDLSSEDGKSGWIIGSNGFSPTVFGWVRANEDGTLGEYKEFKKDGMGGGWWVWGNTLYITMLDYSHICVDLASDHPEGVECKP